MNITGTHFAYYWICHRKLWLFANGISMEHTSDLVYEGKMIHENTYRYRASKFTEIEVDGVRIDFYDPYEKVIHETKKSNKLEDTHQWQVKFYIWKLEQRGIEGVTGKLDYPTTRHTEAVELTDDDREKIVSVINEIEILINAEECPPKEKKTICKNCSYFDFCWSGEE
jgi:CRISPR-associated exonuclease Cas4